MFTNIGRTIKVTAKVFWWLYTITIVGILFWWIPFLMYGFGELIEKQSLIAKEMKNGVKIQSKVENKDELPQI